MRNMPKIINPVKIVEFTALPIPGDPENHHMLMVMDGKVLTDGRCRFPGRTAKSLVDEFKRRFPEITVTFRDRTVQ